jgi:hypothetical protein
VFSSHTTLLLVVGGVAISVLLCIVVVQCCFIYGLCDCVRSARKERQSRQRHSEVLRDKGSDQALLPVAAPVRAPLVTSGAVPVVLFPERSSARYYPSGGNPFEPRQSV